jgi:hypothetical protein
VWLRTSTMQKVMSQTTLHLTESENSPYRKVIIFDIILIKQNNKETICQ